MGVFRSNYTQKSDENLMELIINGDDRAFGELYDRYAQAMFNYFHRMLWKDREKAEDFVHDLFTKIVNRPDMFDVKKKFKTWFYSIANNMCKNEYKKQQVRSNTYNGLDESYNVRSSQRGADQKADDQLISEEIDKALSQLEEKHKQVFELRYFDQLSMKEIADIIEISEGTVKSRLFYATKKLASELEDLKVLIGG